MTPAKTPKRQPPRSPETTKSVGRTTKRIGGSGWGDLFASTTLTRLLALFMTRPQDAFYQRELVGATGAGLYAVQRELRRLEQAELVVPTPRGNRLYYRANRAHPAFEDLKRLVLKTVGVGDAVRAALSPVADRVQVAWIFGSFARGSETSESDLDICVVGDLTLREVSGLLSEVGRSLGRELNLVLYRPAEFRAKAEAEHHFVSRMIKDKKMYLIGDEHALERLAG